MPDYSSWIPMRWPCGPLEIALREGSDDAARREVITLQRWNRPAALELLAGTPVNCLVVTWAAGEKADAEQQQYLRPLVDAARKRGLAVVGWVQGKADLAAASAAARESGLDALAGEVEAAGAGIPFLRFHEAESAHHGGDSPFLGISKARWPGVKEATSDSADAGPTGAAWLDSNSWYVRVCRELVAPETIWLEYAPPEKAVLPTSAYAQALADAESSGARWMVSLDANLRFRLSENDPEGYQTWTALARLLSFFRGHEGWNGYRPVGQLGVISSYADADEFLALEVLNLLSRQNTLYRVMVKDRAPGVSFDGLDAMLYVDPEPPEAKLQQRLYEYAASGGVLIGGPAWEAKGKPQSRVWLPGYTVNQFERGRVAVAEEEFYDPYLVARDAHLLMSHSKDLLRIFNPGTLQVRYGVDEGKSAGVIHLLRYAARYYHSNITLWFKQDWRKARFWLPNGKDAVELKASPAAGGVEFVLPPAPIYSAVELEA
jgi:hypothetical protein